VMVQLDAYLNETQTELKAKVTGACKDIRRYFDGRPPQGPGYLGNLKLRVRRNDMADWSGGSAPDVDTCLQMKVAPEHADLLSSDRRESGLRQKKAERFVEFNTAATVAGLLSSRRLPPDAAETVRQVRNYLVHWDEAALNETLNTGQTISQHIQNPEAVRSTIIEVANFMSDAYYQLREHECMTPPV